MIQTIIFLVNEKDPLLANSYREHFRHAWPCERAGLPRSVYNIHEYCARGSRDASVQQPRRLIEGLRFPSAWCDCGSWYQTFQHSIYDTRLIQTCIVYYYDDLIPRNELPAWTIGYFVWSLRDCGIATVHILRQGWYHR